MAPVEKIDNIRGNFDSIVIFSVIFVVCASIYSIRSYIPFPTLVDFSVFIAYLLALMLPINFFIIYYQSQHLSKKFGEVI